MVQSPAKKNGPGSLVGAGVPASSLRTIIAAMELLEPHQGGLFVIVNNEVRVEFCDLEERVELWRNRTEPQFASDDG